MRYTGDQNQLSFFYESGTYGTVLAGANWIGLVQSHDLTENPNRTPIRYGGTATRNMSKFVDLGLDYTGKFTYYPQDWKFLMFALGSNVDSGSPTPYLHTMSEVNGNAGNAFTSGTQNPFVSFQLEDSKTALTAGQNYMRTAKGCVVDSYEIAWEPKGIVECTVGYLAQSVTKGSGAKTAVTESTTAPYVWRDIALQFPSGTQFSYTKSGKFSIENNFDAPHYSNGSSVIAQPVPGERNYGLDVTMDMDSLEIQTLYDQYFNGGSSFNGILNIIRSAGSQDVAISLSGCKIVDMTNPTPITGTQEVSMKIQPQKVGAIANDAVELYNAW